MTGRAEGAVLALAPSLHLEELLPSDHQWRDSAFAGMPPSPLLLASEINLAFLSTNLASLSAFDGCAAGPRHFQLQFLVPQVGLLS